MNTKGTGQPDFQRTSGVLHNLGGRTPFILSILRARAANRFQNPEVPGPINNCISISLRGYPWRKDSFLALLLVGWFGWGLTLAVLLFFVFSPAKTRGATADAESVYKSPVSGVNRGSGSEVAALGQLYIREYRVEGVHQLKNSEVEEAVYPYLGPGRSEQDVEQARAALEKVYHDKGFQAVLVQIPQQQVRAGVVLLEVVEEKVGRLRVKGARYFLPSEIKKGAPSLAEGTVPNFNAATKDLLALNQNSDRQVTPVLKAGAQPGTVDVDLNVKDTFPLHGSLEFNNRYSPNTTELRLNGSLSYDNLWQLGHKIGASFQIAPQRLSDAKVFSGYYIAPIPKVSWLSLMAQGTRQNSDVTTLGGLASVGDGTIIGGRALASLPSGRNYYESLSFGLDYKHFLPTNQFTGPITYYPLAVNYSLTLTGSGAVTELNLGLNFSLRGIGASPAQFNNRRLQGSAGTANTNNSGDGSYIYLRGDLSHTHDLPGGLQLYARAQGQIADQQLVDTEQYSGGGLSNARGYLESTVTADNAVFGTLELRSPSIAQYLGKAIDEWRFYVFSDDGYLWLYNTDPQQYSSFTMASVGVGSRARLFNHLNGELVLGLPLINKDMTDVPSYLITFRVWGEF